MEYRQGSVGRIFYVRFDHEDDFLAELKQLIAKEDIRCGWFQMFGGMRGVDVVTGPKEPVMPPEPVWERVDECREILGVGSFFWDNEQPLVHIHAAMGHHGKTMTGCVREKARVYLLIEAVIYELAGMNISRPWFADGGFNRPQFC